LEHGLSEEIVAAVEVLTHREGESREAYLDRVITAGELTVLIKAADLADNSDPLRLAVLPDELQTKLVAKYSPDITNPFGADLADLSHGGDAKLLAMVGSAHSLVRCGNRRSPAGTPSAPSRAFGGGSRNLRRGRPTPLRAVGYPASSIIAARTTHDSRRDRDGCGCSNAVAIGLAQCGSRGDQGHG
jgi:hypothetical protein